MTATLERKAGVRMTPIEEVLKAPGVLTWQHEGIVINRRYYRVALETVWGGRGVDPLSEARSYPYTIMTQNGVNYARFEHAA